MRNQNLLELMYGIAETGSVAARDLRPGEVVSSEGYGDDKRDVDQVAEDAVVEYFLSEGSEHRVETALKPEDAEWGEGAWLRPSGNTLSGEELGEVDYGFVVDQVEGTKNYDNRDRYTTLAAVDPENPALDGVEASMVYRWDDTIFFSDGEQAYQNFECGVGLPSGNIEAAEELTADGMDKVNYDTKIRGQMIGLNARDYATFMENVVDRYGLEENDWPSLKADGTTTGDILGAVTDNSIAVDVRALRDRDRLPFAQDFAPAARIAKDAGAKVMDERGNPVGTNFTEPGAATAFMAVPPGKVSEDLEEELPELMEV